MAVPSVYFTVNLFYHMKYIMSMLFVILNAKKPTQSGFAVGYGSAFCVGLIIVSYKNG